MAQRPLRRLLVPALVVTLSGAPAVWAQEQAPPAAASPQSQPPQSLNPPAASAQAAADLERIKAQLGRAPALKLDDQQLRFYVEVVAKQPTIADLIGSYDLINGPTRRGAPMTHQEYLNMVTPKDFYSSAGIKASEMLQFALTNWLGQQLIKNALEDLRNAKTEREVQEIRARIDRELAALRGK